MSTNFEDLVMRDTRTNQPAAGIPGRLYYVTDESVLERDNGATWEDVSVVSPAGAVMQIAETIVGAGGVASVTFSSLGSYNTLHLLIAARSENASTQDLCIRFNSDSGNNYLWFGFRAALDSGNDNELKSAGADSAIKIGSISGTSGAASDPTLLDILIPNYRKTVFNKSLFSRCIFFQADTGAFMQQAWYINGTWKNTAAITSITIYPAASDILEGSVFTLYGIT